MSNNSVLPATGEIIRSIDKDNIKTQVIALDIGGSGAESLVSNENPMPVVSEPSTSSFLERIALRALAKLTYTLTGVRVDCGGSSVVISSGTVTTVTTVTTVGTANLLAAIGYNTQNGQSIQQSQLAVQCGFRRNIT